MARTLTFSETVSRSIQKKFRKELWNPFISAIKEYRLIEAGDRIAVCISGGKDSMLLAKMMQLLQPISEVPFELAFLVMDPGYHPANRRKIEENARLLEIPVTIFESDIFNVANATEKNPCYLCARMRRGALYAKAKELGCNKIALGHHKSDVIETTVLAMLYGAQLQGMMPKLHSLNFEGMELIRPLYQVLECDIIAWARYNSLEFIECACRFTEKNAALDGTGTSKRQEVKELLRELKKTHPDVEKCIFQAIHAVNVDTFPSYKKDGKYHSFLEEYEARSGRAPEEDS